MRFMMTPAKFECVYQDAHLQAFLLGSESDSLLVTFNPAQLAAETARLWGASTIKQLGWAGLGFVAHRANFFPPDSIEAALERAGDPQRGFSNVVTLGWSMGGYGALKYAKRLGAALAVALSPQNPNVRAAVPDTRESLTPDAWRGRDVTWRDLPQRTVILYDPLNALDHRTVDLIVQGGVPGCAVVPTWCSGHKSALPFVRSGQMAPLVLACWKRDLQGVRRATTAARRLNQERPVVLARYAAFRHPVLATAIHACYRARFGAEDGVALFLSLARIMWKAGRRDLAGSHLRQAVSLAGEDPKLRELIAKARELTSVAEMDRAA